MGEVFSLAVWNVFQCLHHDSRPKLMRRNPGVVPYLRALDADVLVLPEAWRYGRPDVAWAEQTADELGYELHQWIGERPSRRREICKWRMVVLTRIPARRLDDHVLPPLASLGRRAIVRVELPDHAVTVAGLHLYGIHLWRRSPRAWFRERAELRIATARDDVVAGDFNMWGPVVRRDAGPLRSAVSGRTFPSGRPHSQIDHVLVRPQLEVVDAAVLPDMGSDHRAVRVTLRRRTRAPGV